MEASSALLRQIWYQNHTGRKQDLMNDSIGFSWFAYNNTILDFLKIS